MLVTECLKGLISLAIAFYTALRNPQLGARYELVVAPEEADDEKAGAHEDELGPLAQARSQNVFAVPNLIRATRHVQSEIFSGDCWKLSVPACLYVIQNNVSSPWLSRASSLADVSHCRSCNSSPQATSMCQLSKSHMCAMNGCRAGMISPRLTLALIQNLKILTTALFSVILLRRRLSNQKWFALFLLAAGVGVVQLQSTAASGSGHAADIGMHEMNRFRGLTAVAAACMTSGLAGVYFEMVLKGSKSDLWIRNVQLSAFSILPALVPVFFSEKSLPVANNVVQAARQPIFAYFGIWAWSVVAIQVIGGLVTALVIKYRCVPRLCALRRAADLLVSSDNIMKGFATSLAIVLSFFAGVMLFNFHVTTSFVVGTVIVVGATYLYNQPDVSRPPVSTTLDEPLLSSKGPFVLHDQASNVSLEMDLDDSEDSSSSSTRSTSPIHSPIPVRPSTFTASAYHHGLAAQALSSSDAVLSWMPTPSSLVVGRRGVGDVLTP